MTFVKVKGFKIFTDRHGKARCYHRKSGTAIDLAKCPIGSLDFFAECERLRSLSDRAEVTKPGSLGLLIERYRAHDTFQSLAPRTKADYQKCFNYLKSIDDTPLVRFTPPLVVKIRDRAVQLIGRRQANYVRTVMALLFAWGVERGYLTSNPASKIKSTKKPKDAPEANRPWHDNERNAVMNALPAHMRLPIALMMFCALDPQDAVKLPKTAIENNRLKTKRGKTSGHVGFNLPQALIEVLAIAPSHDAITLCATSYGKPWTLSGFQSSWARVKRKLEISNAVQPGLTLKGLRHTVATILAEMGCDERTIADMLGQKTTEMARHYSRHANKTEKGNAVVKSFDDELNKRRTKVVKPI